MSLRAALWLSIVVMLVGAVARFCTRWKPHFVDAALALLFAGLVARGVVRLEGR